MGQNQTQKIESWMKSDQKINMWDEIRPKNRPVGRNQTKKTREMKSDKK